MKDIDQTHYTRAVTRLGDHRNIIADKAIYTDTNIKLVEQGSEINSSFYERLTRHKLLRPLDEHLKMEEMVDQVAIATGVEQLLRNDSHFQRFEVLEPLKYRPANIIGRLSLPPPLAFKLTVLREERPEQYKHSLVTLVIALFLAAQLRLTQDEAIETAFAALMHDIGLLHIDPQLLEPNHRLSDAERRHLYAHPVIGYLLLKPFASEIGKSAIEAVYQHHERNDGSGYPQGLVRKQISQAGRILIVAEIIASRFDHEGHCQACHQLEFILKMNSQKVDPEILAVLSPLLAAFRDNLQGAANDVSDPQKLSHCLKQLLELVDGWQRLKPAEEASTEESLEGFISEQIRGLTTTLSYAGLNLENLQELLEQFGNDAEALEDFLAALQEVRWQLKGLWNELNRRWPGELEQIGEGEFRQWLQKLEKI